MKVANSEQMREIDRQTISRFGVPSVALMENAGAEVAQVAVSEFNTSNPVIICGKGGNGGDGFVCARHLAMMGVQSKVFLLSDYDELKGDALVNFGILSKGFSGKIDIHSGIPDPNMSELSSAIQKCDLIIDAMLGTGLSKAPKETFSHAIELVNSVSCPVLSIDMPSGVDGSTGQIPGISVSADVTCTFGLPKIGQLLNPGAGKVGKLLLSNVGFPSVLIEDPEIKGNLLTTEEARQIIPVRSATSHKGHFGKVLIIGGSSSYPGAPVLSGLGAMKTGAGITRLIVPETIYSSVAGRYPEMIVEPAYSNDEGVFSEESINKILDYAKNATVTVLGPGITRHPDLKNFITTILTNVPKPLVIDADALFILASSPEGLHLRAEHGWRTIITPHMGEASKFGSTSFDISKYPISTAQRFSGRFGTTIVLKSSRTIITSTSGEFSINTTGNSSLSKGGSGDVLTGIIAGLIAQGLNDYDASILGSFLLGVAGEMVGDETCPHGVISTEIANMIPYAIAEVMKK